MPNNLSSFPKQLKKISALGSVISLGLFIVSCENKTAPESIQEKQVTPAAEDISVRVPASNDVEKEVHRFLDEWRANFDINDPAYGPAHVISLLDLEHPGLEKVKAAAAKENWSAAEAALFNYFKKERQSFYPAAKKHSKLYPNDQLHSSSALKHELSGNKNYKPSFRGNALDWSSKAVIDGKTIDDAEWLYQYHRLTWWESLAKAYAVTADERYYTEWEYELVHYAQNNLPVVKKSPKHIRRGMEAYYRGLRTAYVLPYMIQSEQFDSKTLLYVLSTFHHTAEHIRTVYARQGNHLLGEYASVFKNSLSFPEFKKAPEWREEAIVGVQKVMSQDMYSDGMNDELVFSYHTMYTNLFYEFYELVKAGGHEDKLSEEFTSMLPKMYDVMSMVTNPDLSIPQFGDAWKRPGSLRRYYEAGSKRVPHGEELRYISSKGKKGTAPTKRLGVFPISGFYSIRDNWSQDRIQMVIKNGEKATWHNQPDNGTFTLLAYGRDFMNDSGCYIYASTNEDDKKWRAWFRNTKAHQTITLDGQDAERQPTFHFAGSNDNADAIVVENQSYENLAHRRHYLFAEKKFFIIYDEVAGEGKGKLRAHFQLVPDSNTKLNPTALSAQTNFEKGANLLVKSYKTNSSPSMQEEEGWISYKYNEKQERPAWAYVKEKTNTKPVNFLTALLPYKEGETAPKLDLKVQRNGTALTFTYNYNGEGSKTITLDANNKTLK